MLLAMSVAIRARRPARPSGIARAVALCMLARVAQAQPSVPVPEPNAAEPALPLPAAPPAPATEVSDAVLEARYHGAFEALARGERDIAVGLLQSIVDDAPQHSLADR